MCWDYNPEVLGSIPSEVTLLFINFAPVVCVNIYINIYVCVIYGISTVQLPEGRGVGELWICTGFAIHGSALG